MATPDGLAMDWSDVRVFLAVAREGSMRAAGRKLGLSQPTIARHLAAFEVTFGGPTLFDRLPEGLRLNAAGEQLLPATENVEQAMLALERQRAAASSGIASADRYGAGVDRGVCRWVPCSMPVGINNGGAPVRYHVGTCRVAGDGKPRATRSRYGIAPSTAGKWRLLRL